MTKNKADINIMDLLAKSVAKINAMEDTNVRKRKLENEMPITAATCPDTAAIVYHYLRGVSPSLASTFLDINPDMNMECNVTLEEVVQKEWKMKTYEATIQRVSKYKDEAYKRVDIDKDCLKKGKKDNSKAIQNEEKTMLGGEYEQNRSDKKPCKGNKGKSKVKASKKREKMFRKERQFFTPREDEIILNRMEEMGDDLNMKELAEELGRERGSVVKQRVEKLKSVGSRIEKKMFSLAEDEAIMERVLPGLHKNKLHELVLHRDGFLEDFAAALGRSNKVHSLVHRWSHFLQPCIMQHYAGNINLDIRMMLMNHLAETYSSRGCIDWNAVAEISEFAGHTALSLQYTFTQVLRYVKKSVNTENSWEQLLDRCREHISKAKKCNSKKVELRRFQVIEYFEKFVKNQEIVDFL